MRPEPHPGSAASPREVIQLLNDARTVQVRRLEMGEQEPEGSELFSRAVFKEALRDVLKKRLERVLYAEYPALKWSLEQLNGEHTSQTRESLARVWRCEPEVAESTARRLAEIGFFEQRGTRESPEYWVPFLYRDALQMVQGAADVDE